MADVRSVAGRSKAPPRRGVVKRLGAVAALILVVGTSLAAGWWWLEYGTSVRPRRNVTAPTTWRGIEAAAARGDRAAVGRGLDAWLRDHPDDGKALVVLAGLRYQEGREVEGRAILDRVRPDDPAYAGALSMRGDLALKRGDVAEVERVDHLLAARDPAAVQPRKRLVFLLSLELRTAEAREVLWELYQARPTAAALDELVSALLQVELDVRGHGPELERFLRQSPTDPWLRRAEGLGLHWRGRSAEALPYLEEAATRFDRDPTVRFALAECRRGLGIDDAEASLGEQLGPPTSERAVDRAAWHVLAGRLAERGGRPETARPHFETAVAANPLDREAQFRLAETLTRAGRPAEARPHRDQADSIQAREKSVNRVLGDGRRDGFGAETCERLGALCDGLGWNPEARAWYGLALQGEPDREPARSALEKLGPPARPLELARSLARPRLRSEPAVRPARTIAARAEPLVEIPTFEDIAPRAGVALTYDSGATGDLFIVDTMGGGIGLIDFDEDGWLDLYLVNGCKLPIDPATPPAPNRLLRNQRDGTFADVTRQAGVGGRGYGMGCAVADYDGDGHDDLFVTGYGQTILYRNQGNGTFEDVTARAGVASVLWSTAAGFGDLDGDGDLDLMVVTYVDADPKKSPACRDNAGRPIHCSPGYYAAQIDLLFRNNGDGTFTDVSRTAGIDVPNGRGLGLAIADLDDDGKLDLFVANDASPNFYFHNLGNLKFEELAMSAGLGCDGSGKATASMGVVAADLNEDGRVDIFHTNFLNEPNTLRLNLGDGQFHDATLAAGLDAPSRASTGFGAVAIDTLNRGRLDLFVANGHVDDQPWVNSPMSQPPHLYLERGPARYTLAAPASFPYLRQPRVGRGVASGDLDNDGRPDLVVVNRDASVAILRNTSDVSAHWISLDLRGARGGRTPVGARLTWRVGARSTVQWLCSGQSYLSASDRRFHLGLGSATGVDRVEVRWPSGREQVIENLAADHFYRLDEGQSVRDAQPATR